MPTRHLTRAVAGAVVLASTLFAVAPSARAAEPIIAIGGTPPRPIARFAGDRWAKAAESLPCAAPGTPDRIVATGGAIVQAPVRVNAASAEWKTLEPAIAALFEKRQREHSLAAGQLARIPVQVDAIYRAPGAAASRIYYFEASRRIPDPGTAPEEDPKGTFRLTVSGWLSRSLDGIAPLGSKSQVGWDEDRPDGSAVRRPDLAPLAVVAHDSRSLWVMKGGVGDIRWISLYEVGESGVRTAIDQIRCLR